jgi:hypothetical protein
MADDKKAQEEASSPFALGAASPLAPGADSPLSLSPQPKRKTVTADLGGPAPGVLRPGPPAFDPPRPLDIAAGESEKPPDPRVPSSYPGMRKVLKAMSDPPKPKQGEPVTWIDPDYDERTGPILEHMLSEEATSDQAPAMAKPFSETDAWVYGGIGGAAFSTVFGIGLVGIFYEHEPIPGALLSLVGFCGLVAMVILLKGHRLTVIHAAIAALIATWVFFGYIIWLGPKTTIVHEPSDDVAKASGTNSTPLPPERWPTLTNQEATAFAARVRQIPPENIVVACETINCKDLADGIGEILLKTAGWKVELIHHGGLDITGVAGIRLNPIEPNTQALKEAIESTTHLPVTLGPDKRITFGNDQGLQTILVVGTRPF